ncbi:MAG: hypothetical protein JWN29_1475 [Acidimicrobiales bacterium]|nr:hypothetical protein [Acidimicrobiales bacterium]
MTSLLLGMAPWRASQGRALLQRAAVTALVLLAAVGLLLARGWDPGGSTTRVDPSPAAADMPTSPAIEHTYGVRFTNLVLTAADGIVELRFQVLDASKAAALHDAGTEPYVTVHGARLETPAMGGHGHASETAAGRAGYLLLSNTGHAGHAGDEVTVHVGDLRLDHVTLR